MAKAGDKKQRSRSAATWWAVGFALSIVFGLLAWAIQMSWPKGPGAGVKDGSGQVDGQMPGEPKSDLGYFMDALRDERFRPDFPLMQKACPLHPQEMLDIPVKRLVGERFEVFGDNSFGGVATDLMKIGLGPPESGEEIGEPSIGVQDFDSLVATCRESGATFSMQDLQMLNADPASADALVGWDLAAVCPPLAARDQSTWTIDERRLVRLLTQRQWGAKSVELGFTALTGAYVSNLSVYVGRDYKIESAAWYALAAAYFQKALTDGSLSSEAQVQVTLMTLAELERLLGDAPSATLRLEQVKAGAPLPQGSADVMQQMLDLAHAGNNDLARAAVQNVPEPPVGWYLDKMLPGINGQLQVTRQQWGKQGLGADWGKPDAVLQRIIAGLDGGAGAAPASAAPSDPAGAPE